MNANNRQVGGNHYKTDSDIQHWDVVYMIFGGDYLLGNASKYMARVGKKGDLTKSIEDLEKAVHYLEKKKEKLKFELEKHNHAVHINLHNNLAPLIVRTVDEDGSPTSAYVHQD